MKKIVFLLLPFVLLGCEDSNKNDITDQKLVGLWQCATISEQEADYNKSKDRWEESVQRHSDNQLNYISFKMSNDKLMIAHHLKSNKPLSDDSLYYTEAKTEMQLIQSGEGLLIKTKFERISNDKYKMYGEMINYAPQYASFTPTYKRAVTSECLRLKN